MSLLLDDKASVAALVAARNFPILPKDVPTVECFELMSAYLTAYGVSLDTYVATGDPWIPVGHLSGIVVLANYKAVDVSSLPDALVIRTIVSEQHYNQLLSQFDTFAASFAPSTCLPNRLAEDFSFPDDPREAAKLLRQYTICQPRDEGLLDEYLKNYDTGSVGRPTIDDPILDAALEHMLGLPVYPMHLAISRSQKDDVLDASKRKRFGTCTILEGDDYVVMVVNSAQEDTQLRAVYRSSAKTRNKTLIQLCSPSKLVLAHSDIDLTKNSSATSGVDLTKLRSDGTRSGGQQRVRLKQTNDQKVIHIDPKVFERRKREYKDAASVVQFLVKGTKNSANLDRTDNDTPALGALMWIIHVAIGSNTSDIHFEQFDADTYTSQVRFRIDGALTLLMQLPTDAHARLNGVLKNFSSIASDKAITGAGRIDINHKDYGQWYGRLEAIPCNNGNLEHEQNIVIRLTRRDAGGSALSLNQIGFEPDDLNIFKKAITRPYGINIICGPTGSGKTTTLYAALEEVNKPNTKIVTAESPIERAIPGINQVDTGVRDELSFDTILKSFLRFDPDIILVGETRTKEEAKLAIEAALTGHLIFTTLHTNSAAGAIPRLLEMGMAGDLLAESLNMIQAQRLIRRLCPSCKVKSEPTKEEQEAFLKAGLSVPEVIYRPSERGCAKCGGKSYSGRAMIVEIVPFVDGVKAAVMDAKNLGISGTTQAVMKASKGYGMRSLFENGLVKVQHGMTSFEEVAKWNTNWLSLEAS